MEDVAEPVLLLLARKGEGKGGTYKGIGKHSPVV